jgi:hypothetical protein
MSGLLIILAIALKFVIPCLIPFFPFLAGWANFVLDTVDGDILIPLGLANETYQPIDKIADWCTYVGMVVLAYRMNWPFKRLILGLFIYRSIGQILFLLTRQEILLFFFPNFLEPLFLITVSILAYKRVVRRMQKWEKAAFTTIMRYRWLIAVCVILYKLQDEYITHVGNIDRSDLIQKLLG